VLEKTQDGWWVKVGSVPPPWKRNHYIEWIELVAERRFITVCSCRPARAQSLLPRKGGESSARVIAHPAWVVEGAVGPDTERRRSMKKYVCERVWLHL
jgi:hypothetical protein